MRVVWWVAVCLLAARCHGEGLDTLRSAIDDLRAFKALPEGEQASVLKQAHATAATFLQQAPASVQLFTGCVQANMNSTGACDVSAVVSGIARQMFKPREHKRPASLLEETTLLQVDPEALDQDQQDNTTHNEVGALVAWSLAWLLDLSKLPNEFASPEDVLVPDDPECHDTPNYKDAQGETCEFYKQRPTMCKPADEDEDDRAGEMGPPLPNCCVCRAPPFDPTARTPLSELVKKWGTIRAVLGSFDTWYGVWVREGNGVSSHGGVNSLCYDWLPYIHRYYSPSLPSSVWGCEGESAQGSKMADIAKLFAFSDSDALPLSKFSSGMAQNTRGVRVSIETAIKKDLGTPEECKTSPESPDCVSAKHKQTARVKSLAAGAFAYGDSALWQSEDVRDFVFRIWMLRDDVFQYFCQQGPRERLQYVFDMRHSPALRDSHYAEYVLPKTDLQMCWTIMETALSTRSPKQSNLFDPVRNALVGVLYLALLMTAVRTAVSYTSTLLRPKTFSSSSCESSYLQFNTETMASMTCTNEDNAGSYCFVTCKPGYGEDADGVQRSLFSVCGPTGLWEPNNLQRVCDTRNA